MNQSSFIPGLAISALLSLSAVAQPAPLYSWANLPTIAQPAFRKDTITITSLGAKPDGVTLNTKAIKEVIYVVDYSANLSLNDLANSTFNPYGHSRGGNNAHLLFLMKYDDLPGMTRDILNGRPFNRYMPTRFLLDLYGDNDARYEGSFNEVWYANATTRPAASYRGFSTPTEGSDWIIHCAKKTATNPFGYWCGAGLRM